LKISSGFRPTKKASALRGRFVKPEGLYKFFAGVRIKRGGETAVFSARSRLGRRF